MRSGTKNILRTLLALGACFMILMSPVAQPVFAQEARPTEDPAQFDPTLPQDQGDESTPAATEAPAEPQPTEPPADDETPAANEPAPEGTAEAATTTTTRANREDVASTTGAPATLAHGLAYYDGDDLVWQVQEIEVPLIDEADSATSDPGIVVQREGQSIVRNDATGKRALLNPGDAFFITADDSYTIMAEDDGSVIWRFSLVDPDDVASDAFYESPTLTAVRDNTYDLMLVRYVLQPGESTELPTNNGAGMVMPGSGEVRVDHGGKLSLLGLEGSLGQGQMLRQPTTISNASGDATVVYYLYIGDTVSNDSAAPPNGQARTNTSTTTTSNSGNTGNTATTTTSTDGTEETTTDANTAQPTQPAQEPTDGVYRAQINIYAQTEIYVTVTVDGTLWFDAYLPEGRWTGPMIGTTYEVYTSSGENTLFEDACGNQFYMGYEPGEARYTLTANATSCAPPE